ncbi:aldose epimerase family protein [Marilutibacter alkalisoli]|uniref:Aldose 1-epimerase n=1 Tax=Marilutibacter alkalisoli TaxID=2591633 RepID=A0A514BV31_9GAMM|nr:aldose epimerase family protein [Lysobacter alkalisoli]QDH71263.1 galactose mutarotase [Lysobacter alkalisoli]
MKREFGTLPDGSQVHLLTLRSDEGLEAEVLTYGGILQSLRLEAGGEPVSLVLGLEDLPAYLADTVNLGRLVGRTSGRIAHGRYEHDGRTYRLSVNEGHHHLHGGSGGFGRRLWRVEEQDVDRARLACTLEDGEDGYPGRLEASVEFRLQGTTLHFDCTARCDAPTPFDPTYHPYFNLGGDPAVPAAEHWLRVPADRYLPVDAELIPLGEIARVDGTPFDFRQPVAPTRNTDLAHPQIRMGKGYDHCLVLADAADCSAELYSPHSGVAMRVSSDAPALVFYEGQILDAHHPRLGRGVCLEPQGFPDAPNRPGFPDAILRPGRKYARRIAYRFARVAPGSAWEDAMAALTEGFAQK